MVDRSARDKLLAGEKITISWTDAKLMIADGVALRCGLAAAGNSFLVDIDKATGTVVMTLENAAALKPRS